MKKIILFLIPIFCLIAFSGSDVFWQHSFYDGLRIYQLIILILFAIYSLVFGFEEKISFSILCLVIVLFFFNFHTSMGMNLFYCLFIIGGLVLNEKFKHNQVLVTKLSYFIALTPCLTVIYLIPSLFLKFQGVNVNWYQFFENFRMLDDAMLPCVFLIWYWQYETKNRKLKYALFLVSILYLLSFFLNGARSVLFAIIATLIFISIAQYKQIEKLKFAFISVFIASILYASIRYFLPSNFGSSLIREGTSGRIELWTKAIQLWIQHPVLGVGGNQFIAQKPDLLFAHPHNYILLWLSEYGILGLCFVLISFYLIAKVIMNKNKLNIILYGLLLSIFCNALFSGSFVYPLSQMMSLWSIIFVISKVRSDALMVDAKLFNIFSRVLIFIVICLSLIYFKQDIFCVGCGNYSGFVAPGFWLDGKKLHLSM